MLQLFIPISLDALEQGSKSQLLLVTQFGFLLLDNSVHLQNKIIVSEWLITYL